MSDVQAILDDELAIALESGEVGLDIAVFLAGDLIATARGGIADIETGRPVTKATSFWIGSVTKALVATGLHLLINSGRVDPDAAVADFWPAFAQHGKEAISVRDALSHRAGVPLFPMDATPETIVDYGWVADRIAGAHPIAPNTRINAYHSFTFGWILGEVIRGADPLNRPVEKYLSDELFQPLLCERLWLGAPPEAIASIALTHNRPDPEDDLFFGSDTIIAVPPAVAPASGVYTTPAVLAAVNPSAGAVGDAVSVGRVFAMLANGGSAGGHTYLSPEYVRALATPRPMGWDLNLGNGCRMSINGYWMTNSDGNSAPMGAGDSVIGHTGAGGNLAWADLDTGLAVVICANRMGSGRRHADRNPLVRLANRIRDAAGVAG